MDIKTTETVINYMRDYGEFYREMVIFLLKKHTKIMSDDLTWLTKSLNEEQAFVMRSQSLETKRLDLFKQLGIDGYTMNMLIENSPEDYKAKMRVVCREFCDMIDEIKRINSETTEIVEKKLENQQELVKKAGIINKAQTYSMKGAKVTHPVESKIIRDI